MGAIHFQPVPNTRHSKREMQRSEVSDLESRFGGHKLNVLGSSGVPNHTLRFAARVFGMTRLGRECSNWMCNAFECKCSHSNVMVVT